MVAAITGILMGLGTLISYGGYSIINSITGNNSTAANTTRATMAHSNQSNNLIDDLLSPLNISKNIDKLSPLNISTNIEDILDSIEIKNISIKENTGNPKIIPIATQQKAHNKENTSKIETQENSKDYHETKNLQKNTIHDGIEQGESYLLAGRELNYDEESYTKKINTDPVENVSMQVQNQNSDDASDDELNTNDQVHHGNELYNSESPERLNPKLTLNTNNNNKNNMEKLEKENVKKMFDFEPFPSFNRKTNDENNINDIPENPLYKKHFETQHKHKVPVKNPLYPIHNKNEIQHQENLMHLLNEIDSQSYEKINPKLTLNAHKKKSDDLERGVISEEEAIIKSFLGNDENSVDDKINPKLTLNVNKNIKSKEDVTIANEINSMENHNLDSNVNLPEAESLINNNLASEVFEPAIVNIIDSLVSKKESNDLEKEILSEEEAVIKSFLGNDEISVEDMSVKTLFTSYAEIAGIVIASVLIVTGLIFLSIRQAMKHRRQNKIHKRYAENEIGRVNTLTYAYTNDVE